MKLRRQVFAQWAWKCVAVGLLTVLFQLPALQAQKTVTGVVVDANSKEPIPGATIIVKGTTAGTATDVDGSFSLNVPKEGKEVEISFLGYDNVTLDVTTTTFLNVFLTENARQLSEVVVTALGIEKEKARVGYAVQDVKGS